jgi:hypothetical protein
MPTTKKKQPAAPAYRVRFVQDPDAQFEECNGEARPLTAEEYAENEYMRDGQPIPYEEYLSYYGNPDRHVYLQCDVEKRCLCCAHWAYAEGLGGIDFMDDDPELRAVGDWYTPIEAEGLPGYLRMTALECLEEAGYRLPRRIRCQRKGCRAWHCTRDRHQPAVDERYCHDHQPGGAR